MSCALAALRPPTAAFPTRRSSDARVSLSWGSSFRDADRFISIPVVTKDKPLAKGLVITSAWTRRSRSEAEKNPNRKSWKQRTDKYMRPFLLNVFFSKRFVHAKVMHRVTSKVVAVATTNAKDLRHNLPSLTDVNACRVIGELIAERSKEADVFVVAYEAKKDERIEGKLGIVLDTIKENGVLIN
ncbi:hypothetical protein MLD38_033701 [Melastoma candidum]|uniref:Uncharacterized protein n=1 Tax=Melastoma candidum TaxID=119954 RepID=A0ACB9MBY4_9MYRT|nr:hypothetical protein MLD38_033701 [Melastoma candidum]